MKTSTLLSLLSCAALAATFSACKSGGESADGSVASGKAGSLEGATRGDSTTMMGGAGGMGGTAGMGGMAGMSGTDVMTSGGAFGSMETRLHAMDGMSADQLKAALPEYSRLAGDMLSRMGADVQTMHMSPNASWGATTDSIRQDLSHMTGLTGAQLQAAMPAYHARMTRLMGMQRQMMGDPNARMPR